MVIRARAVAVVALLHGTITVAHATPATCRERLSPPRKEAATGKRPVTARDLIELRDFGAPDNAPGARPAFSVSPDGRTAAIAIRRADIASDGYCFGIALVPLDGGAMRLLDTGGAFIPAVNDIRGVPAIASGVPLVPAPLWSRDGRAVYYLRRDHGVTQVWRADLAGRARTVTSLKTDALSFEWAADGTHLLIGTRPALQEGEAAIEREGREGFHFDARFWALSEARPRPRLPLPETILLLDTASGRLRPVTPQGAAPLRETLPDRPAGSALFAASASGNRAWTAPDDPRLIFAPARLHVAAPGEIACPEAVCARRVAGIWWRGADELLILRGGGPEDRGQLQLYGWRPGIEPAPRLRLMIDHALTGCILWRESLLCAREAATEPRRLVAVDPDSGVETLLFDPNPETAGLAFGPVRRLGWTNAQGMRTYGDLVLPPAHRPGERHPLIVVQYISRGFLRGGTGDEYPMFLLARHRFAVLSFQRPAALPATERASDINALQAINIKDWAERRAIVSALDAGVDAAIATGTVDPERVGITGMSDGATTTQFALNTLKRFKAAAIGTCCDEPSGLFSVGPAYRDAVLAWGYPRQGDDGTAFWKPMSLAANASTLRTPLLIQIPDAEYRWSLETVSALDQHGAPVDMYVFPDENHVKAHPAHRAAIYRRSVGWFAFWLFGTTDLPGLEDEVARWRTMRQAISRN
jgi:hypothetical protein